jgi:succinate dehydrogenase / fumarate reductase cytochrome b subunit
MASTERPLSPHLQIYKPQISSTLSILHRATGIALSAGTLLLVYWLVSAAAGPEAFATAQGLVGSILGRILLFGWSFALFYHLGNGIRHLAWDAGWGFELPVMHRTGWAVVIFAVAMTLIAWIVALVVLGV